MKTSLPLITLINFLKTLLLVVVLSGCVSSVLRIDKETQLSQKKYEGGDLNAAYIKHYNRMIEDFLVGNSRYVSKGSARVQIYLKDIIRQFFEKEDSELIQSFKFFYYDDQQPFYLISPSGKVILSKGLIEKYIRNQSLLSVILLEVALRIKYNLFFKTRFIPTGSVTVSQALTMLKIDLVSKTNLNKWIYYYLKKSKGDVGSLLDWVQVKNRNVLDFSLLNNNGYSPLDEEKWLKKFKGMEILNEEASLSSKTFYKFRLEVIKGSGR